MSEQKPALGLWRKSVIYCFLVFSCLVNFCGKPLCSQEKELREEHSLSTLVQESTRRTQMLTREDSMSAIGVAEQVALPEPVRRQGSRLRQHSGQFQFVSNSKSVEEQPPCMTLGGHDIGCLASDQWIPADVLRQRGRTIVQAYCDQDDEQRRAACALATFLNIQAEHQEDIGAAAALRAYYSRIAMAEQIRLTMESQRYIEQEAKKQQAAQEMGLPATTDLTSFSRLRFEVRDNQLQIQSKDRQLRNVLSELTGVNYESSQICQEKLEVQVADLDCERLKAVALQLRQDLRGWKYLYCQVNEDSAPVFAKMLATVVGGWGLPLPTISGLKQLLCPPDYSCLAANMRYEIRLTIETHRKWIRQAVDEKCEGLVLAYQRMELAQEVIESWEQRVARLEELDRAGENAAADLAAARSELLKARAEEISRRVDAKIAEVDLAEACGGISDRCCGRRPWLLMGTE
ncbi:MAG: hypothetical protein AAF483_08565 [Planctomycetota bacterium]